MFRKLIVCDSIRSCKTRIDLVKFIMREAVEVQPISLSVLLMVPTKVGTISMRKQLLMDDGTAVFVSELQIQLYGRTVTWRRSNSWVL